MNQTTNLKSKQLIKLNEISNILNNINMEFKVLNSKTNEINKIVNNKKNTANLTGDTNVSEIYKTNNLNIVTLLLANFKNESILSPQSSFPYPSHDSGATSGSEEREGATTNFSTNNKGKYFSVGNKNLSLNTLKFLLDNFNLRINTSPSTPQSTLSPDHVSTNQSSTCVVGEGLADGSKKSLREYLNLITKFEHTNNKYNLYQFNKGNKYIFAMRKAANFLNLSFNSKGCLINKPTFELVYTKNINSTKIVINLFYYIKTAKLNLFQSPILFTPQSLNGDSGRGIGLNPNNNAKVITELFGNKFSYLTDYLTKLFNKEVELNLVRLYKPYQESNILVQHLNSESYTNKFIKLTSRLFKNINLSSTPQPSHDSGASGIVIGGFPLWGGGESDLAVTDKNSHYSYPSNISGLNVKLAGRAVNERIIPRFTVKRAQRGSFNRLNAKLIEKSMFTDKTRKGAYSFTVTLSQNFR